jgi:uncharacterized protein YebE (UPF0316 family)
LITFAQNINNQSNKENIVTFPKGFAILTTIIMQHENKAGIKYTFVATTTKKNKKLIFTTAMDQYYLMPHL